MAEDTNDDDLQIVLPDGTPAGAAGDGNVTERKIERKLEDREYIPVIIKRTDETRRHPDDTLEAAIEEGLEQLNRSSLSLVLSSLAAGLIVGFTAMAVAVVQTAMLELEASRLVIRLATAFVYPLGFVICVMSGAQLFTEHTATALYPVLDRQSTWGKLLRLWAIIIIGNVCGAALGAFLHTFAIDVVNARPGYIAIGHHLVAFTSASLFVSAILAGWLMALGAWLAVSSPRLGSQTTFIYVVTFLIGIGGLHHSIAGSAEMFSALFLSSDFDGAQAARFISVALLGNLVGGSCFVALLNYAHIRRTRSIDRKDSDE
jgi:formate/nitrite transporter FocA (FNT family)